MDLKGIVKTAVTALSKNSPAIFTGLGIVGVGTAVVMAFKAGPAAKDVHEYHSDIRRQVREFNTEEEQKELISQDVLEEAKELAPVCLPAIGVSVLSVSCFLLANKVHADRQAALMAAYSLSTETLTRYQEKVIEKLGEETHSDILQKTMEEVAQNHPEPGYDKELEVIPHGMVRCYDTVTGRYFYCSKEKIMEAESEINRRLLAETRVPLQEFYYALGLEERFQLGEAMGWDISSYYAHDNSLQVVLGPHLDDEKNPCLALYYHVTIFDRSV